MRTIALHPTIPRLTAARLLTRGRRPLLGVLGPVIDRNTPDPALPGPRFVRLANIQCGICATDVAFLNGRIDPNLSIAAVPARDPLYLGHELVARVVEAGSGVTSLCEGDRVIMDTRFQGPTCASCDLDPACQDCVEGNFGRCSNPARFARPTGMGGGWSEGMVCHESEVWPAPAELSDDEAMLIEPFSLGVRAALKRLPGEGERALVIGAGMAGLATTQAIRGLAPGAIITVVGRHAHQRQIASRLGADTVLPDLEPRQAAKVAHATFHAGRFGAWFVTGGYEVVYDTVASSDSLNAALRLLRPGGALVMVGIDLRRTHVDLSPIWHQEVDVKGVLAHGCEEINGQRRHTYEVVVDLMRAGLLQSQPFITDRFPLHQWVEAVRRSGERHDGVIRVVLDINPSGI